MGTILGALAGRPGDPAIAELWHAVRTLRIAVESYQVDNGVVVCAERSRTYACV